MTRIYPTYYRKLCSIHDTNVDFWLLEECTDEAMLLMQAKCNALASSDLFPAGQIIHLMPTGTEEPVDGIRAFQVDHTSFSDLVLHPLCLSDHMLNGFVRENKCLDHIWRLLLPTHDPGKRNMMCALDMLLVQAYAADRGAPFIPPIKRDKGDKVEFDRSLRRWLFLSGDSSEQVIHPLPHPL